MITFEPVVPLINPSTELQERKEALFAALLREKESGSVGYYSLPGQSDALIESIESYAASLSRYKEVVVIGIGGSSLGTKAIHTLYYERTKSKAKPLHFLENGDPSEIERICASLSKRQSHFVVISKSGTTIETISLFKYVLERFEIDLSDPDDTRRFTFVTEEDSPLSELGNRYGIRCFPIPRNVGGRFSVLSAVGLLPLALAGFKIRKLIDGAKRFDLSFFGRFEDHLLDKAIRYYDGRETFSINVLFAYSSLMKPFNEWVVQLWGESLGKRNARGECVGLTPVGLVGSVDQHSFLQLLMEGPGDKSLTLLRIDRPDSETLIPDLSLKHLESADYLNGVAFGEFLKAQCDATYESLRESRNLPLDRITLSKLNLKNLGSLIFYYELLTSAMGILLEINTYDQPGVELGKTKLAETFRR